MTMRFLTAEWRKLILINYEIDPDVLKPFIPNGTELDIYKEKCYVSLVGFIFKNTKVLGLKIPGHHTFEEVNLRFYVKRKVDNEWRRGVVFIKEIVPKAAITYIANTLYKEHYETRPMSHKCEIQSDHLLVSYAWKKGNTEQNISVKVRPQTSPIDLDTEAHFITEHFFGYTKYGDTTFEYEVQHPTWQQYSILDHKVNINFSHNYGESFGCLQGASPVSVFLAEGSKINVLGKTTLKNTEP